MADTAAKALVTHDIRILSIALPVPLRRCFDYSYDPNQYMENQKQTPDKDKGHLIGRRVQVNFGSQVLIGVVVDTKNHSDYALDKIKSIDHFIDTTPLINTTTLHFLTWAAHYYHYGLGEVIHAALPKPLRKGEPFTLFESAKAYTLTTHGLGLSACALNRAKKQQAVLQHLLTHGILLHNQRDTFGFSHAAIKGLIDKQLVCETTHVPNTQTPDKNTSIYLKAPPLTLTTEQDAAVSNVIFHRFQCSLLEGVTGSGKTEVYMQLVARVLNAGKQALILIPEIGLCPQTISRFKERFNVAIAELHSGVSEKKRYANWQQANNGQARIIIGTRLAILAQSKELGIIIIDEEHDGSYKQQDTFRYSARDVGVYRANQLGIPIVLGSATPSLETLNNALNNKYTHLKLLKRAGNATPPKLLLNDTRGTLLQAGLSPFSLEKIRQTLQSGKQALLFLNRRGFASAFLCVQCGWVATCQGCEIPMTYHNQPRHLHCHRCDKQNGIPRHCPSCNNHKFSVKGLGTEQIAATLDTLFDNIPVIRIDRDTTNTKDGMQNQLSVAHEGHPCLLVGTQMLAKGHHLPNVNLVVVIDADQGFTSPDFRGVEHVGQLITQVAGRAGRESNTGEVVIQTLQPDNLMLNELIEHGYPAFARALLHLRKASNMPPFGYSAVLRAECKSAHNALTLLNKAHDYVLENIVNRQITTIGPLAAPIEKTGHRFRFQYQLFSPSRKQLHSVIGTMLHNLETQPEARRTRWSIDIDPISFA